jgi:hypothetical protein
MLMKSSSQPALTMAHDDSYNNLSQESVLLLACPNAAQVESNPLNKRRNECKGATRAPDKRIP